MDLFEYMRSTNMEKEAPLAARMRPRTLDEVVGQEHIIGMISFCTVLSRRTRSVPLYSMDRPAPARRH